ncbi:Gamma-aminobutyric acid type B receptor subunit 1, partial [Stegodyphus mimosarum]
MVAGVHLGVLLVLLVPSENAVPPTFPKEPPVPSHPKVQEKDLYIGAIFPINGTGGWLGGQGCLPAALMALDDVNARPDLLPGYHMKMPYYDSQCNPGLGASVMYDLLYNPPQKLMLLGGCSIVCSTIAEAAKMW